MRNKKAISVWVIVASIFTTCTFSCKKELENSFVVKISADELLLTLSGNSKDKNFREAFKVANEMQRVSNENYITIFSRAFNEVDSNANLATIFSTVHLRNRISYNSTNEEVLSALKHELDDAIDKSINILLSRIDRYGIRHQNIQRIENSENILIELPAVKNIDRVKRLIETRAKLEFWETYKFSELYSYFEDANEVLCEMDIWEIAEELKPAEQYVPDSARAAFAKQYPLFAFLRPALTSDEAGKIYPKQSPVVGYATKKDTATVNYLLNKDQVTKKLPQDLRLYWGFKPISRDENMMPLLAIKVTSRDGSAPLDGLVITDATVKGDQNDNIEINMSMNSEGAKIWQRITANNIGRSIAITLDDYVYSYPRVMSEIKEGQISITGQFTEEEAQNLVNILRSGPLPLPVKIVEENIK